MYMYMYNVRIYMYHYIVSTCTCTCTCMWCCCLRVCTCTCTCVLVIKEVDSHIYQVWTLSLPCLDLPWFVRVLWTSHFSSSVVEQHTNRMCNVVGSQFSKAVIGIVNAVHSITCTVYSASHTCMCVSMCLCVYKMKMQLIVWRCTH